MSSSAGPLIMVVDDDVMYIEMINMMLGDDYQLCVARTGKECIDMTKACEPDLILLDVGLPDMDGYEVCAALKNDVDSQSIPVVFVSHHDEPVEQLKGFEVGGVSYICKPIDEQVLRKTVDEQLKLVADKRTLSLNAQQAMSTAFEAMTANSEMGLLMTFFKESENISSIEELESIVHGITEQFGVECCFMLSLGESNVAGLRFCGCDEKSREAQVMQQCKNRQKIFDFGSRTIFNEPLFSILVKNMPLDEPSRYGRLKDNMMVLCNMVNNRLLSLSLEIDKKNQRIVIVNDLIDFFKFKIEEVNTKTQEHDEQVYQTMEGLIGRLQDKLLHLGLEENQEALIMKMVEGASSQLQELKGISSPVRDAMNDAQESLRGLLNTE